MEQDSEAVEFPLSGVNSSLLIGGVTAVWQHNNSAGGDNELPKLTEQRHSSGAFRGTRRRPNTQQSARTPTTSRPLSVHGPHSLTSSRQGPHSARDQSKSPDRDETTAGANGLSHQQPSIWARPSDNKRTSAGRLPPANMAAAGGFSVSKSSVQEWLKSGPADRDKMASAPTSDTSRPSTSMSHRKYMWDAGCSSMIRETMDKGAQLGGLINAMGSNPAEPDAHRRMADQQAIQWFRDSYPSGVPSQRQDTLAARLWLDEQMQQLRKALAPRSRAGSPQPQPRVSSSGSPAAASVPLRVSSAGAEGSSASPRGGPEALQAQHSPGPSPRRMEGQLHDVVDSLRENLSLSRDAAGFLTPAVLAHQEEILSRCMMELCGQVASSCLERGFFIYQLWMALRCMLKAVAGDRETARGLAVESRTKETECMEGMHSATAQLKSDNDELTRMTDTLSKRLLIRQAEVEIQKNKVLELQSQLGALAGVKPELLRQQIADSNASLAAAQKYNVGLSVRLERAQGEIGQKERDLQLLTIKIQEAQEEAAAALIELQNRTPRPRPPAHPPWDLLDEEQSGMCLRALREGCSAEDLHRLLIGVSASGANLMPYWELLGCCRYLNPAVPGSLESDLNDAEGHDNSLESHLPNVWRNDAPSTTPAASRWGTPQKASGLQPEVSMASVQHARPSAVSRPVTRDGLLAQTLPLHTRRSTQVSKLMARRTLVNLAPPPVPVKELHTFLTELLQKHSVPELLKHLPEPVVQSICQMLNHGVDVESTTCLLLGSMSYEGFEVTKFKSLAGVLKSVLRQGPEDIGGPITEAVAMACGSTCERVLQLEQSLLLQRRRALTLARAGAEEQQREAEHAAAEERRRQRKLQRRPHPLLAITALKRAESFPGLGTGEDVPHVLRYDGKVYCSHMDAREAVRTVRSLWAAKAELESNGGLRQLLPDFLFDHMNKKYGKPQVMAEAMYNLLYTSSQNQHIPELCLFLKAFMGEVEDTMQEEQARLSEALLDAMAQRDFAVNQHHGGWLGKAEIRACLQETLGQKSDAQVQELVDALDSEEPTALCKCSELFEENAEGQMGLFAQVLLSQHISDRLRFHQATEEALLDAVEKGGEAVTPAMLSAAIAKAHPQMSESAAGEMLARVFGTAAAAPEAGKGKKAAVAPVAWEEASRKLRIVPPDQKPEEAAATPTAKAKGGKGKKDAKSKAKKRVE